MRVPIAVLLCSLSFAACSAPMLLEAHATQQVIVPTQDGGTREVLESIAVPPLAHAPFTGILHTEWTRGLFDGGTITVVNQRQIARDSSGRIYQERWYLVPKNGRVESQMSHIQISDPGKHTLHTCYMEQKKCELTTYTGSTAVSYRPVSRPTGMLPNGDGENITESLGTQNIDGVETAGTRETTVLKPWVMGNDREMKYGREFWYSSKLGINLLSKVTDARSGMQSFSMTDLSLTEPDPKLFVPPHGFEIIDLRKSLPDSDAEEATPLERPVK